MDPVGLELGEYGETSSRATLWRRLSQHRGNTAGSNPGGGNHRGSIFRRHVGTALIHRDGYPAALLGSWLAAKPDPQWVDAERILECQVSRIIGAMPFLWLNVPTNPDGSSDRAVIERNAIGLLSQLTGDADPPTAGWLGHHAANEKVPTSGLWNVNHVDAQYDPTFLDLLARYVG